MTNPKTFFTVFSLAVLVSLALTTCHAKDAPQISSSPFLASKLVPQTRARSSRSLSDMFEKMRSKIFGSRKQANSVSQVQPAASVSVSQRQPWGDMNSFNQQYSPYSSLSSNYQWPTSSAGNQFLNQQQFNPLSGYISSQAGSSAYPGLTSSQSQPGAPSILSNTDGQQQSQSPLNQAANSNSASNGGLLSSASQLIAQYLSPSSASANAQPSAQSTAQQVGQNQMQANGQAQNLFNPQQQQQQQQTQYNEFASILDSMVAQTGASSQRQPNLNQYLGTGQAGSQGQHGMQLQQGTQGYQSASSNMMGSGSLVGDNDMSASSNIQSYMPASSSQQASQKSSMVGLAEQLAPGAQFNKLVSFPFSLSNNDDPSKEGRYKLHIPFLNQHVKRSDQQQQAVNSAANQQRQQQYLNSYYGQQQQYASSLANQAQQQQQQQLIAQSSQVVPTIVNPQSSASASQSQSQSHLSSSPVSQNSPNVAAVGPSSQSSSAIASSSVSSSSSSLVPQSSSSMLSSQNNPSASSSVSGVANSRPAWSVADLQSGSSSSKLIPLASSSVDSSSQS